MGTAIWRGGQLGDNGGRRRGGDIHDHGQEGEGLFRNRHSRLGKHPWLLLHAKGKAVPVQRARQGKRYALHSKKVATRLVPNPSRRP